MEPDDFDDPPLAARLRQWGAATRRDGGAPVDATPDLAAMHRRLDADASRPPRRLPLRPAWAAAAAVFVGMLLWSVRPSGPQLPMLAGTPPELREVVVSARPDLDRGQPEPPLPAAGRAYLHFFAATDGVALLLLLTPQQGALLLTPTPVPLGDDRLGPFALPAAGHHVLLVVVSASIPDAAQVAAIAATAESLARRLAVDDAEAMRAATAAHFGAATGLRALCLPIETR